jgi:hypothetical protein
MFTLLYGLFEYLFKKDEFHVLILGLDKAGKTNVRPGAGLEALELTAAGPLGPSAQRSGPSTRRQLGCR